MNCYEIKQNAMNREVLKTTAGGRRRRYKIRNKTFIKEVRTQNLSAELKEKLLQWLKTSGVGRACMKSKTKGCEEETGDFSSIDPYITETIT